MANRAFVVVESVSGAGTLTVAGILNPVGETPPSNSTPQRVFATAADTSRWSHIADAMADAVVAYYADHGLVIDAKDVSVSDFR